MNLVLVIYLPCLSVFIISKEKVYAFVSTSVSRISQVDHSDFTRTNINRDRLFANDKILSKL